ncbi:MAG: hypothetical protein AAB091_02380 [Elusimicrobiota bacterium]
MNLGNKKKLKIARLKYLLVLLIGFLSRMSYSQVQLLPGEVLPVLKDVRVSVSAQFSPNGIFTYSYAIVNLPLNTGKIDRVEVDISRDTSSVQFGAEGLINDNSFVESIANQALLVPIGLRSPTNWISGLNVDRTAGWGAVAVEQEIAPGKMLDGFLIQSRGVPGIRGITLHPEFAQTPVDEASESDVQRLDAIEKQIKFNTVTIGPDAPESLEPISLIDRLISLKHQSISLRWIFGPGSKGITNSLDAKLNAAKDSVSRGNNDAAKGQLGAFINEAEAQHGKHLNDNAFFLLKVNAEFIVSKLGSP